MEHGLWEPTETLKLTTQPVNATYEKLLMGAILHPFITSFMLTGTYCIST